MTNISANIYEKTIIMGKVHAKGEKGDTGEKGDKPSHDWIGTNLTFENPDGSPGQAVDLKGEKGDKGLKGDKGEQGLQGIQGIQGEVGPQGIQGIKGDKGDTGEQGPQGLKGDKGDQGDTGPIGLTGPQGPQGIQGEVGPIGPQGEVGPQGPQGIQGEVGPQGIQGIQGEIGPEGPMPDISDVNYSANSVALTNGTVDSGTLADTYERFGNAYTIAEANTTPGFVVTFDFVNIVKFNHARAHVRYDGGASTHTVQMQLYNYTTLAWVTLVTFPLSSFEHIYDFNIDDPAFLSNGNARMRFYHPESGHISHRIYFTYIALSQSQVGTKGDQGDTGPQGPQGEKGANWRGSYSALTAYVVDDVVEFNGSSYICILNSTGNTPTNTTYFELFAQKGLDGEGSGDMLALVYDPTNKAVNVYNTDNHVDGTNNKVYTAIEKDKLSGVADNANNYVHPANHPPSVITQDANNRFVTDTEKSTWTGKQDALGYTPLNSNLKGEVNGLAELDSSGHVPASQLPSYVDDVLEFLNLAGFPATGETGKVYVAKDTNVIYRWSGSGYVEISASLALGETSSTAYRGDRGKTAYDHSQEAHAPSNANNYVHPSTHSADMIVDGTTNKTYTAIEKTKLSGIQDGAQVNAVTTVAGQTGAVVLAKADVGLSLVDNLKQAVTLVYTSTLNTTWTGTVAPFTKAQTVTGILATDTPIIDIVLTGTYATDKTIGDEWGKVYRAVTSANVVTFYAHEKPTVNLPLQIKVVK